jgi:hypothetical protein
MVKYSKDGSFTITGEDISVFRFLTLKGALKLQMLGMTRKGASALTILKKEFGYKGNCKKVFIEVSQTIGVMLEKPHKEVAEEIKTFLAKIK